MAIDPPELKSGPETLVLTPRRVAALRDIVDAQISLDDMPQSVGDLAAAYPQKKMAESVSGREEVTYPIACRTAMLAARSDHDRPECRWIRDCGGYSCKQCGVWVAPGKSRFIELQAEFGDEPEEK